MRAIWLLALFGVALATSALSRDPAPEEEVPFIKHSRRKTLETLIFYRQMREAAQAQEQENRFQLYLADRGIEWESRTSLPPTTPTSPVTSEPPQMQVQQTLQVLDEQVQHQRVINDYLRDLDVEQTQKRIQATIPPHELREIRQHLQRKAMAW